MQAKEQPTGSWFSRRLVRRAVVLAIPLLTVVGMRAVAWTATQLKQWNEGDVLKAVDLNDNFAALGAQIAALSAPRSWTPMSLASGWSAYGDGYATPSYARDTLGIVHLRGLIKGTPAPQTIVAVLPAGFRPPFHVEELLACGGTAPCTVVVKTTGEVVFEVINSNSTWLSFDGLTYEAIP
jgi:hypothetical protein